MRFQPEMAVVDQSPAPGSSPRCVKQLRFICPKLKLILLSVHDEPSVARLEMGAGADGFVLKRAIATNLLPEVDAVLHQKSCIPAGIKLFKGHFKNKNQHNKETGK